jgi:DNA methylase
MGTATAFSIIPGTVTSSLPTRARSHDALRETSNLLYKIVNKKLVFALAPSDWKCSCTNTECTLHQIAPYVGKLKSSIARSLVQRYSTKGNLVVDPFAGAGTIVLEAALAGRRAFGSDISPYARVLSNAKLFPPNSLQDAIRKAERALDAAAQLPAPDLRSVPLWVRAFFHPATLREAINFAQFCRAPGHEFLFACFLGILHHQRPGFLSYPSSHLVPYLRDKKYPKQDFPEMYSYRELRPRLIAKITRMYARFVDPSSVTDLTFRRGTIEHISLPRKFDSLITSPPYMNALDYGRDNRLRLWFIDPRLVRSVDNGVTKKRDAFISAVRHLAHKIESGLNVGGFCVLVVGESLQRTFAAHPSEIVFQIMTQHAPSLRLKEVICDDIPDVRRTRRECKGIKREHFLVFQKNRNAN